MLAPGPAMKYEGRRLVMAPVLASFALSGRALVDPAGAVPRQVEARRWGAPLLLLALAVSLSGTAWALRLDTGRVVMPKLAMKGDVSRLSEREISDEVAQAQRVNLVVGVAKGVLVMPLLLVLLAVALKIVAWLLARPLAFPVAFTAGAVALLPLVVFHLIWAAALWNQDFVTVRSADALLPTSLASLWPDLGPVARRAARAVDLFNLWSAALLGLAFGSAVRLKAWQGVLLGLLLYALFAAAALVGLPGLLAESGGGPPGGGRGPPGGGAR